MRMLELIKTKKVLFVGVALTGVVGVVLSLWSLAAPNTVLFDTFDGPDGVITSPEGYASAEFPKGGTSKATNTSSVWEGDSGKFYRQGNWGYSGKPTDWGDKYFFRYNTRNFNIGDADISWQYKSAKPGEDGYALEGGDAVDVWLRYQTQYNLYVFQFDRANDAFLAKRKVPAQGWTGPANTVSNKGVYYSLPTDTQQPKFGAGAYQVSWAGVESLLPASEKSKPNFPNLAHDGKTIYDFKVTVRNIAGGKVQIQAYRAGVLIYSTTDDGLSGIAANGETQGTHISKGYYNSVPGWQAGWGTPIISKGATGFRSDNIKFWLNDFRVTTEGTSTPPAPAPDTTKPTVSLSLPENNSTISGSAVAVAATASDNVGVSKIEFFDNNTLITTDSTAPYTATYNTLPVADGLHKFRAKAYDTAGNNIESHAWVTIANQTTQPPTDTKLPSVPNGLATIAQTTNTISLKWNPATDNVGVTGYKVYRYGASAATANVVGVNFTDTGLNANTKYTYSVSALDGAGNESPQSSVIEVTTKASTPPPTTGGKVTVSATTDRTWANGYCAVIKVTNTGTTKVTSWSVTPPAIRGRVTSLWNAKWSQTGTTLTVSNAAWNGALNPGQSVSDIGYCAAL